MSSHDNFHISFFIHTEQYDVDLEQVAKSDTTSRPLLTLGGITYAVKAKESQLEIVNKILSSISPDSTTSKEGIAKDLECVAIISALSVTSKTSIVASKVLSPKLPAASLSSAMVAIKEANGSKQAIKEIVKELQTSGTSLSQMMSIATTLAKNGDTVKASHFFFFVQLDMNSDERGSAMKDMAVAFLEYGKSKSDPISLDFALMHGLKDDNLRAAKALLDTISKGSDPIRKAQAEIALARLEIFEVLNPISAVIATPEALRQLKEDNPKVKEAFKQADAIQELVDKGTSPLMAPPGERVAIKGVGGKDLSLHVQLKGNRVNAKDPVVIFESGLGCFSPDWQFVQDSLSKNIQTLSYDRAGMGWSSDDGDAPTAERTIANLEALLDKLKLAPPYVFVGHSYGGIIGQMFALKHPDAVQELIFRP